MADEQQQSTEEPSPEFACETEVAHVLAPGIFGEADALATVVTDRSIIESMPLPLVVLDSDFRIRSTNEAFCALSGASAHSLERLSLPNLATVLWGLEQPLRPLLEGLRGNKNLGTSFEFEHKTAKKQPKVFLIRGRILQADGERFLLLTFEDISARSEVERLLKAERKQLANEVESTTEELARSREELRALTGNLFSTQEEERRWLARELHDDISQRLASVNILGEQALSSILSDPQLAREKLSQTLAQIGQLAGDVRTLSHRLHPSSVEHLGLATALRSLIEEFGEREEMIATFTVRDVPENLSAEVATGLYRIAQEALRNVAKHAGKTHVKVTLSGIGSAIELQIADAGLGFETEPSGSGLGLISMRERARLIGGGVNIQSALDEGTKVTVTVPVPASGSSSSATTFT